MKTQCTYDAYVGLDVHKETIAIAIASPERAGEIRFWGNIINAPTSVRRFFTKMGKNYATMLVCYEAGPLRIRTVSPTPVDGNRMPDGRAFADCQVTDRQDQE